MTTDEAYDRSVDRARWWATEGEAMNVDRVFEQCDPETPRVDLFMAGDNGIPYRLVLHPDGSVTWEARTPAPKPKRWWRRT